MQSMSTDQLVSLPGDAFATGQKYEIVNLLATIARFALPGTFPGSNLERDLEIRFSRMQSISLPDATAWLTEIGVKLSPLDDQIAAMASGDTEQIHQALQTGNNSQQLQLLAVNDSSKLVEVEDTGEMQPTTCLMSLRPDPCLLLRLGYNTANGYAYYAASLAGDSRRPIKITWDSVLAAGVNAGVAILPPAKPLDLDRVQNNLHIMGQAATAFAAAHADLVDLFGQSAPAPQVVTEQAV